MRKITNSDAPVHAANYPQTPSVTVLFGEEDSNDIGMVRVSVPAGVAMPVHRHSGSDVILTPVTGAVRIAKGDEVVDVEVGDTILILKDEAVGLSNPHPECAEVIVAAGPSVFVSTTRAWPEVAKASAVSA